jgi:hypothetical protein
MGKIILLGRCCRVSFDMININYKTETSLFEWVWTDTLSEINFIIQKLINNEEIEIIRINNNDYLKDTNIKTCHYINKDYKQILNRRIIRFMNDIINNKEILFIRDDVLKTISFDEIKQFFMLIKTINPLLVCKMLLLSDRGNFNEIIYPNLYHKIYDKSLYKIYINDCFVSENNENTENKENKENTENTENKENNICDDEC